MKPSFLHRAIAATTQEEANSVLFDYVTFLIGAEKPDGDSRTWKEAEKLAKDNIGYFAGYYDKETRRRLYKLFNTEHPVFGVREDISAEEALEAGKKIGERFTLRDPDTFKFIE